METIQKGNVTREKTEYGDLTWDIYESRVALYFSTFALVECIKNDIPFRGRM